MDKKYVEGIWRAFLEVQEGSKAKEEELSPKQKKLDHDNDGDIDGSDLAKLRKKGPKEKYQKEESEEGGPYPSLDKKKREKPGSNLEVVKNRSEKLKEDEEGAPYPSLDKKKREKPGSNLEVVKNRSEKLKEDEGDKPYPTPKKVKKAGDELEDVKNRTSKLKEGQVECPKCQGEGCDHCDGKGYHMKESALDTSLFSERELAALKEKSAAEPFMSTNSEGEKKFYADHQKSDKKFEDMEDEGEMDAVKAGKAGVTQSAKRRGDNLGNGDSKSPEKVKGQ